MVEVDDDPTEGPGFCNPVNERDYCGKLLNSLRRHLGGREPVIVFAPGKRSIRPGRRRRGGTDAVPDSIARSRAAPSSFDQHAARVRDPVDPCFSLYHPTAFP